MKDYFHKKFSNGDILALADDYKDIDKDRYGIICVDEADKYVMFYIVTAVDGTGKFLMDFRDVEEHYEKIGECDGADELMFTGNVSFKR